MADVQKVSGAPQSAAKLPDQSLLETSAASMREYFAGQPKRTIRIQKDRGEAFVQVNGYTFIIQAGTRVEVPEQVAQMLEDGGYI